MTKQSSRNSGQSHNKIEGFFSAMDNFAGETGRRYEVKSYTGAYFQLDADITNIASLFHATKFPFA